VVPAVGLVEDPLLGEVGEHTRCVLGAEALGLAGRRLERKLEGPALQVTHEHVKVVRVDQSGLGRAAEDEVGVLDDVLVRRRRRRDEERHREVLAAT
jgi:hypothetical protein